MKQILEGRRGIAGVALTFVIGWALVAVVLLTGTLVAAHQIDRDVQVINPRLSHINENTGEIHLAERTKALTAQINTAAAPLTGELAGTLTAAEHIRATARSILHRAQTINSTVGEIHGNVFSIGSVVASIGSNVSSIHSSVDGIHGSVASVGSDVTSIHADATSIHANVDNVMGTARSILATGQLIVPQVNAINARAVTIQGAATGIGSDLAAVFGDVGSGNAANTIDGHANAIDCSNLLNTTLLGGPTAGCGK